MRISFLAFLIFFTFGAQLVPGQAKKPLTHNDYAGWNTISGVEISPDGNWVTYQVYPQEGDGKLIIHNLLNGSQYVIPRGYRSAISPGGEFVVCQIMPQQAVERQARAEGKRLNEMPSDSLAVFVFATARLEKIPGLASVKLPEEPSDWFVYNIDFSKVSQPAMQASNEIADGEESQEELQESQPKNKQLFVYNPVTEQRFVMEDVVEYVISPYGTLVAGIAEVKENDTLDVQQIHTFDTRTLTRRLVDSRRGMIRQIITDRDATQMAWLHREPGRNSPYDLYLWDESSESMTIVVEPKSDGMPRNSTLAQNFTPYFSNDGKRLFFGTAPIPAPEPKDTLLRDEKYSVDIWHWQDQIIQPQQQVNMRRRDRDFLAVYHIDKQKMVQLANEDFPHVTLDTEYNSLKGLSTSARPYMMEASWSGASIRDLYVDDLTDGSRKLIKKRAESSASLSPGGNYVIWYDPSSLAWMAHDINRGRTLNITLRIPEPLFDEDNDIPLFANPHGIAGWTSNDEYVLIYDRHDVWKVDPRQRKAPVNITNGYGRQNDLRLRLVSPRQGDAFVDPDKSLVVEAFHYRNKRSGYYSLNGKKLSQLIMDDASFMQPQLSANGKRMIWRRSTFTEYSDLWMGSHDFSKAKKISNVNPQQADFLWGSVKLVEWQDFDDNTLQGLLYLPEDFDPSKKYPTLVYFYERSSNGLHQHFIPSPSRSTINRPFSTSNGYIVFVPDITYKTGYPGESAYNAVVSGTHAMMEQFPFIDGKNLGLQGQSWGGYQVAYLITRTNMFKTAMAGAPVSNMVSAYGGIRWASGQSRQFQYEHTQSRIGGTLWQKQSHYVENSPVFFADRIETPLLIMHNDQDGAVPWYQGIEMFMAMRRLEKPVWMLVYNGEAHNLTRWANRMDLSVRMYQFFDYYLKGEAPPVWLMEGIPASQKGLVHGYDLIRE